jgi:hypothetical protein
MRLDLREVLVCLVTVMTVLLVTVIAVGAVATYSVYVHATPPERDAAIQPAIVLAMAGDPCLTETAARPPTPLSESGLQCPIFRSEEGRSENG